VVIGGKIAEAFGGREDTVRLWCRGFAAGVAALKASIAPKPPAVKNEAALRVAAPLLEDRNGPSLAPTSGQAPASRLPFVSMRWRLKSAMEANLKVPSPVSASIEPSAKIL
jgi:hypothetical protein